MHFQRWTADEQAKSSQSTQSEIEFNDALLAAMRSWESDAYQQRASAEINPPQWLTAKGAEN